MSYVQHEACSCGCQEALWTLLRDPLGRLQILPRRWGTTEQSPSRVAAYAACAYEKISVCENGCCDTIQASVTKSATEKCNNISFDPPEREAWKSLMEAWKSQMDLAWLTLTHGNDVHYLMVAYALTSDGPGMEGRLSACCDS